MNGESHPEAAPAQRSIDDKGVLGGGTSGLPERAASGGRASTAAAGRQR